MRQLCVNLYQTLPDRIKMCLVVQDNIFGDIFANFNKFLGY